jgi:beta-glucanase (GH16 family)
MKNARIIIVLSLATCWLPVSAQKIVWSDEFNYSGLPDSSKWGNEVGSVRNNELQYYTDRDTNNQLVRNGYLELVARRDSSKGFAYTSASINTKGKFSFTYGRMEARMKLPYGQGLWPAFWTLGANIDQVGWPSCGEIDVMEHINSEDKIYGTVHWRKKSNKRSGSSFNLDTAEFHVYALEWTNSHISWFVDDVLFHQLKIRNGRKKTSELHLPQYLLLNLAVGGNWPGSPGINTVFPATVYVDYVRVYEK